MNKNVLHAIGMSSGTQMYKCDTCVFRGKHLCSASYAKTFVPKKLTGMVVIGVGVAVSSYTTLSFQELLPIAPLVFEST